MQIHPLALCIAITAAAGCQPEPPGAAPPTLRSLTPDAARAQLQTARHARGLNASDSTEIARFGAYVGQRIEGIAAPVEYMREKCPEKVLSARETAHFGLEAPYPVKTLALKASSIANAPIEDVTDATKTRYEGDFVMLSLDGLVVSLFPAGVATLPDSGAPAAKVLREVTAVAQATPWRRHDDAGREWTGVRLTASAHTPVAAVPDALKLLKVWAEDPCQ